MDSSVNEGAMENWGLILYRETALLISELTSSGADRMEVALTVAHEMAHLVCIKSTGSYTVYPVLFFDRHS